MSKPTTSDPLLVSQPAATTSAPQPTVSTTSGLSLRIFALAALARTTLPGNVKAGAEATILRNHLTAAVAPTGSWRTSLAAYLEAPAPADRPLLDLSRALGSSLVEALTITLAAAVDEEPLVGRLVAHVLGRADTARPTLGLVAEAFAEATSEGARAMDIVLTGAALSSGLLELRDEAAPLPERALVVPLPLVLALAGRDQVFPGTTIDLGRLSAVPLHPSLHEEARSHARALAAAGPARRALVLRASPGAEGRTIATVIAAELGGRAAFVETDRTAGLGPWLFSRRLLPVFCFDLAPGERKQIPAIAHYGGPVLVLCGSDGHIDGRELSPLEFTPARPSRAEREPLWRDAIGGEELAQKLAITHRHRAGRIAEIGRIARHHATLCGREKPLEEDVLAASRTSEGGGLGALAQPIADSIGDDALVLGEALRAELRVLLLRCRSRDELAEGLGPSARARYHAGLRALFVGPSGTGKTLAAAWIATRLALPLFRVDLASVTSKYIGETEKNLAQLFARAEETEVVLLFDEADALFGKRTDVRDANDKFANAQTNYLLQRIESFDGIAILTSNAKGRLDAAFARRLDAIIEFPLPGPEERRALWLAHLGGEHRIAPRDLNRLASAVDLSGGHIRNVVLTAAVLAREEKRPIEMADVTCGLVGEYRKLGRSVPAEFR